MNEPNLADMARKIDEIHAEVLGTPNAREKGLVSRTKALEDRAARTDWWTGVLGVTSVGALGTLFVQWFRQHH